MEVRVYAKLNQENIDASSYRTSPQKNENKPPVMKKKLLQVQENVNAKVSKPKPLSFSQTKVANDRVFTKTGKSIPKDGVEERLKITQKPTIIDDTDDVVSILRSLDPNAKAKEKAAKEVAFIFESKVDEKETDYAKDGNIGFYTQDNEKKRAALKANPIIKDAVNSISGLYNFERDGTIGKAEYMRVNSCIARTLRQDLKESAVTKLVEEDWKHDAKGRDWMNRKEVYDSLFELGDIWTPEVDLYQYVAFYERLCKILRGKELVANRTRSQTSVSD